MDLVATLSVANVSTRMGELLEWPTRPGSARVQVSVAGLVLVVSAFGLAAYGKAVVSTPPRAPLVANDGDVVLATNIDDESAIPEPRQSNEGPVRGDESVEEREPETWSDLTEWFQVHLFNGAPVPTVPIADIGPRVAQLRADLPEALRIVNVWGELLSVRRNSLISKAQSVAALLQAKEVASQPTNAPAIEELRSLWAAMNSTTVLGQVLHPGTFEYYLSDVDKAFLTGEREPAMLLYELEVTRIFFLKTLAKATLQDQQLSRILELARSLASVARRQDVLDALSDEQLRPTADNVQRQLAEAADLTHRAATGQPPPLPAALQSVYDGVAQDQADRERVERRIDATRSREGLGATQNPVIDSVLSRINNSSRASTQRPPQAPAVDWNTEVKRLLSNPRRNQ